VVKGWADADGEVHERIFEVAWSGDRAPNPGTGKVPPVGSTVDLENASYTNAIGAPYLEAFWEDPEFDPSQRAFYYVRVLEIPTPRYLVYDSKFYGTPLPEGTDPTQQERAYTSPIWYTPGG
jgi:hypothetical protein